jgi:hypothetical protein
MTGSGRCSYEGRLQRVAQNSLELTLALCGYAMKQLDITADH